MKRPFSLRNETALITGGGTGLGLAMARCFAQMGARVVIVGRRPDTLADAAEKIGEQATALTGDISQLEELPSLWREAEAKAGPVSILVNNAGVHLEKPAENTTDSEFAAIQQVHLEGPFALARLAAESMFKRRKGSIVFVSSMAGLFGIPQVAAYSAAKTGVIGLTRALAAEWSERGVRVNALAPGWIETDFNRGILEADPERRSKILGRTPMGRFGKPEDVGWAAVYLCSPAASFITGTVLPVDGGACIGF
jgi:gluconate 5-dehydrogenase